MTPVYENHTLCVFLASEGEPQKMAEPAGVPEQEADAGQWRDRTAVLCG